MKGQTSKGIQLTYNQRLFLKNAISEKRPHREIQNDLNIARFTIQRYAKRMKNGEDILQDTQVGGFTWQRLKSEQEMYLVSLCREYTNESCKFILDEFSKKYTDVQISHSTIWRMRKRHNLPSQHSKHQEYHVKDGKVPSIISHIEHRNLPKLTCRKSSTPVVSIHLMDNTTQHYGSIYMMYLSQMPNFKYIGRTVNVKDRAQRHIYDIFKNENASSNFKCRWVKKYCKHSDIVFVELVRCYNHEDFVACERVLIRSYDSIYPKGLNCSAGEFESTFDIEGYPLTII